MRINKRLSSLGICSRREADRLIAAGRVKINGEIPEVGMKLSISDDIEIDGKLVYKGTNSVEKAKLQEPREVLLMYHKKPGIVCTTSDNDRAENIIDAINYPERIYPVGRLDKESEGLILMTNMGDLVNRINRSRNFHEKEYIVSLNRVPDESFFERMKKGVYLPELETVTREAKLWREKGEDENSFHIVISQGLNRQIRRMCHELGYEVIKLKRIRIMNLSLGDLKPGEYREITVEDLY